MLVEGFKLNARAFKIALIMRDVMRVACCVRQNLLLLKISSTTVLANSKDGTFPSETEVK